MLLNERKLNLMLTKLYSELPHETVDELSVKIRNALQERSLQGEKVLQLQKFVENVYPKEMQTGEHVVDIAKRLLSESLLWVFNENQELIPEESEANERLLKILHEQFVTHYQGFDGNFEEWLEIRGLCYEKGRFCPIYIASKNCPPDVARQVDGQPKEIDIPSLINYVVTLTDNISNFLEFQRNKEQDKAAKRLRKMNRKRAAQKM